MNSPALDIADLPIPVGLWLGSGASVMKLDPLVRDVDYDEVARGNAPGGPTLKDPERDVRPKGEQSVLTISFEPPPAFAALWKTSPPQMRREIEAAQFKAVRAAFDYLESIAAIRTRTGERIPAGLVGAAFPGTGSPGRGLGLGTQVSLFNIGFFKDGGWTPSGLELDRIARHADAAKALYRAQLAYQLRTWLGVGIQADARALGGLNIVGLPDALVRAVRHPVEGASALNQEQCHERWRFLAAQHGLKNAETLLGAPQGRTTHADAMKLCEATARSLGERSNHFSDRDAVRQLAERCRCGELDAKMVQGYARQKILAPAHQFHSGGEALYKTHQQLDRESRIAETVKSRSTAQDQAVPREHLPKLVKGLDRDLKRTLIDLTTKSGGSIYVDRLKPENRDQLLAKARTAWKKAGLTVVAVGHDRKELRSLYQRCGILRHESLNVVLEKFRVAQAKQRRPSGIFGKLLGVVRRPPSVRPLPKITTGNGFMATPKTVLVVPDGTKLTTSQADELVQLAKATGAKLVVLGNDKQLSPHPERSPVQSFAAGGGVVSVGGLRKELQPLATEKRIEGLAKSGELSASRDTRDLVARWAVTTNRSQALMLGATQGDCNVLNRLAQRELTAMGELGKNSIWHGTQKLHEGDRVVFDRRSDALGLRAGQKASIERIELDRRGGSLLHLVTDDRKRRVVPLRDFPHVSLGYATTLRSAFRTPAEKLFLHVSQHTPERLLRVVQDLPGVRLHQPAQSHSHAPSKTHSVGHSHSRSHGR